MPQLVLAQFNCCHSQSFVNNLPSLKELNCSIIALSDLPLHSPFSLEKFTLETPNLPGKSEVGFAILDPDLKYSVTTHSKYSIELKLIDHDLSIFSFYIPPNSRLLATDPFLQTVSDLLLIMKHRSERCIILGDLNARPTSTIHSSSLRGQMLEDLLPNSNFLLLNHLDTPTFIPSHSPDHSILDWSLVTKDLAHSTWSTLPDSSNSDHALIVIHVDTLLPPPQPRTFVDINQFKRDIEYLQSPLHLDNAIQLINQAVHASTKPISFKYKQPWFDSDCSTLKKQIISLKNRKRKRKPNQDPLLLTQSLRELTKKYKKLIQSAKFNYESSLFNSPNSLSTLHKYTRTMQQRNTKPINYIIFNNEIITDPHQIASIAIPHFFPVSTSLPETSTLPLPSPSSEPAIQLHEIKASIRSQRPSAPGSDRINIHLMHCIFQSKPLFILDLFNKWFTEHSFPSDLKKASLTLIFKDPKKKPTIENIRPIALTSFISRIYERIILNRVNHYLLSRNLFPPNQFAHKKGSSIENALLPIHEFAINNPKNFAILCMDVSNAYNNVTHHSILSGYSNLGLPSCLTSCIQSLLTNRSIHMNNFSSPLHKGIFQGSILSPINFNISMTAPLNTFKSSIPSHISYELIVYSDDINIIFSGWKDINDLENTILTLISSMNSSLLKSGLSLAESKIQFTATIGGISNLQIPWNNLSLTNAPSAKILGIHFQSANFRTYRIHINKMKEKALLKVQTLHSSLRSKLVPISTKRLFIHSHIYQFFTLGSAFIYDSCINSTTLLKICSSIDRKIAIKAFKLPSSISTAATTAAIYPLSLLNFIKVQRDIQQLRLNRKQLPLSLSISIIKPREFTFHPADYPIPQFFNSYDEAINNYHFNYFYYTDASQPAPPPGTHLSFDAPKLGVAWVLFDSKNHSICKFKQPLFQTASVFEAELYAIHLAFVNIQKRKLKGKILSVTDSLSSVKSITNPSSLSPRSIAIQKIFQNLKTNQSFVFICHTKSHSGLRGNEMADKFAKAAASSSDNLYSLPLSKPALKKYCLSHHSKVTDKIYQYVKGSHFKLFFPNLRSVQNFCETSNFNYSNLRLFSGHGPFIYRLASLKVITSDICSCGTTHSLIHMLTECRTLAPLISFNLHESKLSNIISTINPSSPEEWPPIYESNEMKTFISLSSSTILRESKKSLFSKHPSFNSFFLL